MRRLFVAAVVLAATFGSPARADVVHLTTGGTISGTIVRDDDKGVVVRTPDGKVTLPRHMVVKVVKQDPGQTALALARERDKAGAYEEAKRFYAKAAKSQDPATASTAKSELKRMERRLKKTKKRLIQPRVEWKLPEGVSGKPIEGETLQEQLNRARRAIETGDGGRALRLLDPLLASKPEAQDLQFLVARAREMHSRKADARSLYLTALGKGFSGSKRPTAWLCELARRKFAGQELGYKAPGVGKEWQRAETRHFAVYSTSTPAPWVTLELERAFQDTLDTFKIEAREIYFAGRVQVFLYDGPKERIKVEGRGPLGHGTWLAAPDGPLQLFSAHANERFFRNDARHLVAHAVLRDLGGLQPWAEEGAARYVQPPNDRAVWRSKVRANTDRPSLTVFMAGEVPTGETQFAQDEHDAQAAVLFEVFVDRLDPKRALKLCNLVKKKGPDAIKRFKIEPEELERLFLAKINSD